MANLINQISEENYVGSWAQLEAIAHDASCDDINMNDEIDEDHYVRNRTWDLLIAAEDEGVELHPDAVERYKVALSDAAERHNALRLSR